ncbi:MAG TPA: hypothetical protein VMX16_15690 [Terriglobia bacterium]|nr:hypothetical protein [Terriglobia bacterium]
MRKSCIGAWVALILTFGLLSPAPARAGSAAIGSVAGSLNATLGGQTLLPNSVIFSGDRLQVKDGTAVVALERGSRMVAGRETEVSFLRDPKGIAVLLKAGSVTIYHPASGSAIRVVAGKVEVRPVAGYKSLGEIAMANGAIYVTAKEGPLQVMGDGHTVDLAAGKWLVIRPKTAGFPQGGPAANAGAPPTSGGGGGGTWRIVELSAAGTGVILSAVALGHAGSSNSTANSALSTAQSALTSASAASAAAQAAAAAATAATQAANAAVSVADATAVVQEIANNLLGCKLNVLANELGQASPYTPPPGFSCKG